MRITRNVYLLYAIALLQGMVFYGAIATLYRQAHGLSLLQITTIESISLVLAFLFEVPWGIIADKIGYKKSMVICSVLFFGAKLVFWQANSFGDFLLERVIVAVVIAGLSGVDSSILYLSCPGSDCQAELGNYHTFQTAGLLFASLVFSLFVGENYQFAGFLTVITYALAAVCSFFITEVQGGKKRYSLRDDFFVPCKTILKNKAFLGFLIGIALLNETHQTVTVFLSQLQYLRAGISTSWMGVIYIFVSLAGLLGVYSARLTQTMGTVRFVRLLYGSMVAACVLLAICANAWVSIACIVVMRVVFYLFAPLQMSLQNRIITSENRATLLSVNASLISSVGVLTNLAFGAVADAALPAAFGLGAVLCAVGFVLFIRYYRGQFAE